MDVFSIHVDSSQAEIVERRIILVLNETGGSMAKGSQSKVAEEIEVLYPNRLYLMSSRKNPFGFDRIRMKCWAGVPMAIDHVQPNKFLTKATKKLLLARKS